MDSEIDTVAEQLLNDAYYTPSMINWQRLIEHYYYYKDQLQPHLAEMVFEKVEWYREHYSTPQDPILREEIFLPIYD